MNHMDLEYISKYKIERIIGIGSFGTVFLAKERSTNRKIALKICPVWSDNIKKYLMNEITILSIINSNFFPKFYSAEHYNSISVMCTEYCPGLTLMKYLEKKVFLDENTILLITNQIMNAMWYLHSRNIVHRDIKLENIIISKKLKIKICDFGFSTFFRKSKKLKDYCGSIQYCSPEMAKKMYYDGPSNDIWTLGICILKMCIGIKVFNEYIGDKPIENYYSIFDTYITNIKLRTAIKSILVSDPFNRITLLGLYRIFEFKEPELINHPIRFIDPVVLNRMNSIINFTQKAISLIGVENTPENSIYSLIREQFYSKKKTNEFSNDLLIIENNIKTHNNIFCCNNKVYFEIFTFKEISLLNFLASFETEHSVIKYKNNKGIIAFTNKLLAVEYTSEEFNSNMFKITIEMICGEKKDFCMLLKTFIDYLNIEDLKLNCQNR